MFIRMATTVTTFMLVMDITGTTHDRDLTELEIIFRQRTRSDWKNIWHQENHIRCREKIIKHLNFACENDIYRISRRSSTKLLPIDSSDTIKIDNLIKRSSNELLPLQLPWIDENVAFSTLRTRRGRRRMTVGGGGGMLGGSSITNECCSQTGCTWEEYAEYCPTNNRLS